MDYPLYPSIDCPCDLTRSRAIPGAAPCPRWSEPNEMGRAVRTRVEALIKKEGYGAQKTIAKMSGVAQPILCQWLRGRYAGNSDKISRTLDEFLAKLAASGKRLPPPGKPGRRKDAPVKKIPASVEKPAARKVGSKARGNPRAASAPAARKVGAKARGNSRTAIAATPSTASSMGSGWTSAEDARLCSLVQRHGACRWATKVKQLGGHRSENAVRSRWHIYLRPHAPSSTQSSSAAARAKLPSSLQLKPGQPSSSSVRRAAASNASCTHPYLPRASYFAEDGEEELTAAVAVVIKPSAQTKNATNATVASASAISSRGPPLAREWNGLSKKTRELMLVNQPEAVEPLTDPAAASTSLSSMCTFVARSDTAPLPPTPPPGTSGTGTNHMVAAPRGPLKAQHQQRQHKQKQKQMEWGQNGLCPIDSHKRRERQQNR